MPHVEANGLRFHVQVLKPADAGGSVDGGGDAAPRPKVVMLHGLVIDNLSSWYYTIAPAVAMHADVYLIDLRGHGRTDMPATGYTVEDNVDDLVALLDQWGIHEPVHLFGNSFGGVVSLALAHRHPERVASLFLVEAHFAVEGWGEHMAGSLALAAFGLDETAVQDWLAENADPPIAWLGEIACPTYAMYGSESDILDRARELEAKVSSCELEIVPDCSHSLLTEQSALVRERALAWIQRVG